MTREEFSRFHLWRHSPSVPVRWHRGVAEAEVAQAARWRCSGAGAASGASGTTGNSSGRTSGPSGNSVAQPPGGQSSPTGNGAAQTPGSTGQNSINSPGTGVGPGSTGTTRQSKHSTPSRLPLSGLFVVYSRARLGDHRAQCAGRPLDGARSLMQASKLRAVKVKEPTAADAGSGRAHSCTQCT